jgi:hypothetical protein
VLRLLTALLITLPALAQVQADITALASRPSLAAWQKGHPGERFDRANYEVFKDGYEVDFLRLNRFCGASVTQGGAGTPDGATRAALFYVASPSPGALPALPAKQDSALTGDCELDAVWYETPDLNSGQAIVGRLSGQWGKQNGASAEPDIRGWALWTSVLAWHILDAHNGDIDLWAAIDPNATRPGGKPRMLVYARKNTPRDFDVMDRWFGSVIETQALVADAVAQIAALDPALATPILRLSHCTAAPADRAGEPSDPLAKWLAAAKPLPPPRRAAALLLADFYLTCIGTSYDPDKLQKRLIDLGAKYEARFPKGDPDYSHNFRDQAEKLDPRGPAGQLAGLVSLNDPCFLKGKGAWPDLLIEKGTKMVATFPETRWTPYVHFALARAHATRLSFALPGGVGDDGAAIALSPALMQQERDAAIAQFRYFVERLPGTPEAVFAWQEAWRLLAELPPSQIHFGCTGE